MCCLVSLPLLCSFDLFLPLLGFKVSTLVHIERSLKLAFLSHDSKLPVRMFDSCVLVVVVLVASVQLRSRMEMRDELFASTKNLGAVQLEKVARAARL